MMRNIAKKIYILLILFFLYAPIVTLIVLSCNLSLYESPAPDEDAIFGSGKSVGKVYVSAITLSPSMLS